MFETSKDVLNLTLSACIAAFTLFLCLALYNLVAGLRSIRKMIKRIEDVTAKVVDLTENLKNRLETTGEKVNGLVEMIKGKIGGAGTYLMIISEVLKRLFDFLQEKRETKRAKK